MKVTHQISKKLPKKKRFDAAQYIAWFQVECDDLKEIQFIFGSGLFKKKVIIKADQLKKGIGNNYTVSIKSRMSILKEFNKVRVELMKNTGHRSRRLIVENSGKFEDLNDPAIFAKALTKMAAAGVKFK